MIKYLIRGRFEGNFKTLQKKPLDYWEKIPKGNEHFIRIYRGTITDQYQINESDFESDLNEISLNGIKNIQINKAINWPEANDRIFFIGKMKLNNVKISEIQQIKGFTYGKIIGDIVASVMDDPGIVNVDEAEKDLNATNHPASENELLKGEDSKKEDEGDTANDQDKGYRGEVTPVKESKKWFKNLFKWIFLLLILLFIFFGLDFWKQLLCSFDYYKQKELITAVAKERKILENRINKTRPSIAECDVQKAFEGDNKEQTFTYILGNNSGSVFIEYNMFTVPDRMEVIFNGELVAETNDDFTGTPFEMLNKKGFGAMEGVLTFNYLYDSKILNELTIRIIPNQKVPTTKWEFKIDCP